MCSDQGFLKKLQHKIFATLLLFTIILFMIGNTIRTFSSPTILAFSNSMLYTSGLWSALLSGCYILTFRQKFEEIYSTMLFEELFFPNTMHEIKIVMEGLYIFMNLRRLYVTMIIVGISAILLSSFERYQFLPVPIWTPLDVNYNPYFVLIYVVEVISVCILISIFMVVVLTVAGYSSFIGTQCDLICHNLRNLSPEEEPLKKIIQKHLILLKLSKSIGKLLNPLFYLNFLIVIIVSATGLFSFLKVDSTTDLFFIGYVEICVYTYGILQCWFVDEMKRKSELMFEAIIECPWVEASPSFKKTVLIFMHNSETPLTFGVTGLVPISLETFITIVKGSFSYYTVLQNFNNS